MKAPPNTWHCEGCSKVRGYIVEAPNNSHSSAHTSVYIYIYICMHILIYISGGIMALGFMESPTLAF